jgi:succinate dehydrogenase / fumarate reductase membrane anchor subunit
MSLRTPLGRVLGLGSARDGTRHFMAQRVSAVALALLGPWFAISLFRLDSMTYLDVTRFIARPMNGVLMMLLCVTLALHSQLGVQVVIEDYVHTDGRKLFYLVLSRFIHVLVAVAAVYAVLRIGIGR